MEDKYLPEEQWERALRNEREMARLMHARAEYEIMMMREKALVQQMTGNRAERRRQAAIARKALR